MNKKKIAALFTAAAVLLTGCAKTADNSDSSSSVPESQTETSGAENPAAENPATEESGSTETENDGLTVLAENYSALDTVIASSEKGEPITFGDFLKEYKYYLAGNGISDDRDEAYAESLTRQREYIVNYLINAKVISGKFAEYFPEGFSEEELAQIEADYQEGLNSLKASLGAGIYTMGGDITEEELNTRIQQALEQLMDNCGLTTDDFYNWQFEAAEQTKLMEHITGDYSVERSEAEEQTAAAAAAAKESYESDPAGYDADSNASVFIPEGSRYVKHILLKLSDEDVQQIYLLRNEGKNDEADALRDEKLEGLSEKLAEVQEKVAAGEDFDSLMAEYSGDGDVTMTYLIVPGTGRYMAGFAETALGISEVGGTDTCSTDYGWHIIKYIEPAVLTEEDYQATVDGIHSYLTEAGKTRLFNESVKEWREEYNYNINRELLLLGAEGE